MKSLKLTLLLLAMVTGNSCFKSATSGPNNTQNAKSELNTTPTPTPIPQNIGPTGHYEPVEEDSIVNDNNDVTYYDDPAPTPSPTLPGAPTQKCGIVYKQFNNPQVFLDDEGMIYNLREFSYDSLPFLSRIRFPEGSYSACVDGYLDGTNLYVNTSSNQVAAEHPLKAMKDNYNFEYCGHLAYVTNFSGQRSLNLKIDQFYYLIQNQNNLDLSGVPTTSQSITPENSIEACIYADGAAYKSYEQSFKYQINAKAIDKGALNSTGE